MCHCIGQNLRLTTNNGFQFQPSRPVKRVKEAVDECMKIEEALPRNAAVQVQLVLKHLKCIVHSPSTAGCCQAAPFCAHPHGQSRIARPARLLHGNRNTSSCRRENLGKDEVRNPYSHSMYVGLFAGP